MHFMNSNLSIKISGKLHRSMRLLITIRNEDNHDYHHCIVKKIYDEPI